MSRPTSKKPKPTPVAAVPYEHPAIALLREGGCQFTQSPDQPRVVQLNRPGTHGSFSLILIDAPAQGHLEIYAIYPLKALAPTQFETLRLLNHINSRLPGGAYHLDFTDGEIVFRHCVHLGEAPLSLSVFGQALALATHALDAYLPILTDVALGNRTCAEALAHHENTPGAN
jgi:hypothetical protein